MAHSTDKRLRGRKLQDRRNRWFAHSPLCIRCNAKGKVELATELDHIIPLFKHGKDDESNLQGLCKACHDAKTIDDMSYKPKPQIGADGYPVGG